MEPTRDALERAVAALAEQARDAYRLVKEAEMSGLGPEHALIVRPQGDPP